MHRQTFKTILSEGGGEGKHFCDYDCVSIPGKEEISTRFWFVSTSFVRGCRFDPQHHCSFIQSSVGLSDIFLIIVSINLNSFGSRGSAVVKALSSHWSMCPWSILGSGDIHCMWVEFAVGSVLASRGFSLGTLVFPL